VQVNCLPAPADVRNSLSHIPTRWRSGVLPARAADAYRLPLLGSKCGDGKDPTASRDRTCVSESVGVGGVGRTDFI